MTEEVVIGIEAESHLQLQRQLRNGKMMVDPLTL